MAEDSLGSQQLELSELYLDLDDAHARHDRCQCLLAPQPRGKPAETALLTMAMFALGTGVRVGSLRRVGPRPFVLAAATTAWVATVSLCGILLAT